MTTLAPPRTIALLPPSAPSVDASLFWADVSVVAAAMVAIATHTRERSRKNKGPSPSPMSSLGVDGHSPFVPFLHRKKEKKRRRKTFAMRALVYARKNMADFIRATLWEPGRVMGPRRPWRRPAGHRSWRAACSTPREPTPTASPRASRPPADVPCGRDGADRAQRIHCRRR